MGAPVKVCPKRDAFYQNFDSIFKKEKTEPSSVKITVSIEIQEAGKSIEPIQVEIECKSIVEAKTQIIEALKDKLAKVV